MSTGYTVLELLVTLVVLAILAAIAIPGFEESIRSNARDSAMLDIRSSLTLARSEAVNVGRQASICRSVDQATCAGTAGDWNVGWLVFTDGDTAGSVDGDDEILQAHSALEGQAVITLADGSGNAVGGEYLRFDREGFLENSDNGAYFEFCGPDNVAANARAVWVLNSGRALMSVDDADGVHNDLSGANLTCP